MNYPKRLRVAVVGLGFGSAFVPIYVNHPDVEYVGIVDPDKEVLDRVGRTTRTLKSPSRREGVTIARIPIWCTSLFGASSRSASPG